MKNRTKKVIITLLCCIGYLYSPAQTNVFPSSGSVGIGTLNPENVDWWEQVLEVHGNSNSKMLVSTQSVKSGFWAHNVGFYDAPAGGITGTLSNHPFSIVTNSFPKVIIMPNGNVGIGTATPREKLSVNGNIRAKEVKVEIQNWPDYVFTKEYTLPSLAETEKHIKEKGHLPGIPSVAEINANGMDVGEMNAKLLKKIEELTLYVIFLNKKSVVQGIEMKNLRKEIKMLKSKR